MKRRAKEPPVNLLDENFFKKYNMKANAAYLTKQIKRGR